MSDDLKDELLYAPPSDKEAALNEALEKACEAIQSLILHPKCDDTVSKIRDSIEAAVGLPPEFALLVGGEPATTDEATTVIVQRAFEGVFKRFVLNDDKR